MSFPLKKQSKDSSQQRNLAKYSRMSSEEGQEDLEEDSKDEDGSTFCWACGEHVGDEFWICCDTCEKWFHGKYMKLTPARSEYMKQYKCPACSNKEQFCDCPELRQGTLKQCLRLKVKRV